MWHLDGSSCSDGHVEGVLGVSFISHSKPRKRERVNFFYTNTHYFLYRSQ